MPNPTHTSVHRNTPLTNLSVSYARRNAGKYKARSLFPAVGVQKKSDRYYTYSKEDLLRSQAQRRAPGAPAEKGRYRVSDDSYLCERWALGRAIDDPTRANADPQFDLDGEATEFVTDQVMLAEEIEWTGGFFAASVWSGDTDQTGVSSNPAANQFLQFNDVLSTPIEVLRARITNVESGTGYRPNRLVIGAEVNNALADHPDVIDRIKYTQRGIYTPDLLASLLQVDEVVVLNAIQNSAADSATGDFGFIAGKNALLMYTAPAVGLRTVTAGLTFVWTADVPLQGVAIKRYRDEPIESDVIEGETWSDFKVIAADLGAFLADAVA